MRFGKYFLTSTGKRTLPTPMPRSESMLPTKSEVESQASALNRWPAMIAKTVITSVSSTP